MNNEDKMNRKSILRGLFVLTLAGIFLTGIAMASSSNKWRLQLSGGAHSDGVIVLELTPAGSEPINVSIDVTKLKNLNYLTVKNSFFSGSYHFPELNLTILN